MFNLVLVLRLVNGEGTLPWQPILGAQSAEIGDTPSFLGLAFHNGWQTGKADGRVNSAEVLSTWYKLKLSTCAGPCITSNIEDILRIRKNGDFL